MTAALQGFPAPLVRRFQVIKFAFSDLPRKHGRELDYFFLSNMGTSVLCSHNAETCLTMHEWEFVFAIRLIFKFAKFSPD